MPVGFSPRLSDEKTLPRRRNIHEGRTKVLFDGPEPGTYVLYFKDEPKVGDDSLVMGKGVLNNRLSELFMVRLGGIGIETHFLKRINMREQLVRAAEPLPFQVVVHNTATGDFAVRLGLEEGMILPEPIPEFHVKTKEGQKSIVSPRHLTALGWADTEEIDVILATTQRVNDFLCGQFLALGIRLMSYALDFGRVYLSDFMEDTQLILIDEITPDTCCLFDLETEELLGSQELQEIARRFGLLSPGGPPDLLFKEGIFKPSDSSPLLRL